jgi:diguanylate cyclase
VQNLLELFVKTASEVETWRKKYFDSLSSLESEQQKFKHMETALKRLAGRLCTASIGQSTRLDDAIKQLQSAIRRDISVDELDGITRSMTDAIQALDQSSHSLPIATSAPAPSVAVSKPSNPPLDAKAETSIVDESVRAILAALLAELRGDTTLAAQLDSIDSKLTGSLTNQQLPEVLSALAEIVRLRIRNIENAKQEIEGLLSHMVSKLDEISNFVADQNRSQTESQASSETLNIQLVGEMKAMGESVEAARDLLQIRTQVRGRIDSIDRHLQEFRERETALADAMRTRNEQMKSRIAQLEAEATRLHDQLKDEQRLSTIDMLTRIPNRMAYEKRIDEEMKRWQRFKQPTCIAVWDVDHFKRINDTYGHRAGDRVLRAVADCLAGRIRGTDFLARYGGEEFVMILAGTTLEDAARVVDETRVAISKIGFHFRGTPVSITASSGVTALLAGDSTGGAFDRADKALYQAKERGRDRCVSG